MEVQDLERASCDDAPEGTVSPVLDFIDWMQLFCPPQGHMLAPPSDENGRPVAAWTNLHDGAPFALLAFPSLDDNPPPEARNKYFFRIQGFTSLGLAPGSEEIYNYAGNLYRALAIHLETGNLPAYDDIVQYAMQTSVGVNYMIFAYMTDEKPHHFVVCLEKCDGILLIGVTPAQ